MRASAQIYPAIHYPAIRDWLPSILVADTPVNAQIYVKDIVEENQLY
jgi:hypothetical protein